MNNYDPADYDDYGEFEDDDEYEVEHHWDGNPEWYDDPDDEYLHWYEPVPQPTRFQLLRNKVWGLWWDFMKPVRVRWNRLRWWWERRQHDDDWIPF